jgi:hypothetical protein
MSQLAFVPWGEILCISPFDGQFRIDIRYFRRVDTSVIRMDNEFPERMLLA